MGDVGQEGNGAMAAISIKVCGITRAADAECVVAAGADCIGFIFHPKSPRYVTVAQAREAAASVPRSVRRVGVFVNADIETIEDTVAACELDVIQLHGTEPGELARRLGAERVWKACPLRTAADVQRAAEYPAHAVVVDSMAPGRWGGTGELSNWALAAQLSASTRVMLAGGLSPENVAAAIAQVRPAGVDVSSGVEAEPGIKDHDKVRRFIAAARAAGASGT